MKSRAFGNFCSIQFSGSLDTDKFGTENALTYALTEYISFVFHFVVVYFGVEIVVNRR